MLKTLCHPNIVQFIGACCDPICLVTEYCHKGNLFDVLQKTTASLASGLVLKLAMDAARGMGFLHAHRPVIIHRDLKSLNLLVSDRWTLKVSDFGLSRFKANSIMTGQCGTYQWMAPEVIASQHYNEKADVYSYGINLSEMYTREVPYRGMQPMQVAIAVMTRHQRPEIP